MGYEVTLSDDTKEKVDADRFEVDQFGVRFYKHKRMDKMVHGGDKQVVVDHPVSFFRITLVKRIDTDAGR